MYFSTFSLLNSKPRYTSGQVQFFWTIRFRCDGEGDKHQIYVAPKNSDFPALDKPTAELFGEENIVAFDEIDVTIKDGEMYKWRVDCINGKNRRTGDIWVFTMNE